MIVQTTCSHNPNDPREKCRCQKLLEKWEAAQLCQGPLLLRLPGHSRPGQSADPLPYRATTTALFAPECPEHLVDALPDQRDLLRTTTCYHPLPVIGVALRLPASCLLAALLSRACRFHCSLLLQGWYWLPFLCPPSGPLHLIHINVISCFKDISGADPVQMLRPVRYS